MRAYEEEVEREPAKMTGSLEQLVELEEKGKWRRVGLPFMAQRPVCASISRSNIVHRRCVGEVEVYGGRGGGVWWKG